MVESDLSLSVRRSFHSVQILSTLGGLLLPSSLCRSSRTPSVPQPSHCLSFSSPARRVIGGNAKNARSRLGAQARARYLKIRFSLSHRLRRPLLNAACSILLRPARRWGALEIGGSVRFSVFLDAFESGAPILKTISFVRECRVLTVGVGLFE